MRRFICWVLGHKIIESGKSRLHGVDKWERCGRCGSVFVQSGPRKPRELRPQSIIAVNLDK